MRTTTRPTTIPPMNENQSRYRGPAIPVAGRPCRVPVSVQRSWCPATAVASSHPPEKDSAPVPIAYRGVDRDGCKGLDRDAADAHASPWHTCRMWWRPWSRRTPDGVTATPRRTRAAGNTVRSSVLIDQVGNSELLPGLPRFAAFFRPPRGPLQGRRRRSDCRCEDQLRPRPTATNRRTWHDASSDQVDKDTAMAVVKTSGHSSNKRSGEHDKRSRRRRG